MSRRGVPLGNNVSPFLFFPLVASLMMAAYTIPSASNALLKGNDVSYGMYIYHQPVVNTFCGLPDGFQFDLAVQVLKPRPDILDTTPPAGDDFLPVKP